MLERKPYVALLKTGVAEVAAYGALFPAAKELTFPVFNARPWQNASHFSLTVEKTMTAAAGYPFGFALDIERYNHSNVRPAQREFDALFDEARGFRAYYELLRDMPGAVPILLPTRTADVLLHQIANADELGRGLIIHQRRGSPVTAINSISRLPPLPEDTVVIVDAGWSRNYLELEAWAIPALERFIGALPDAEVVVMSSSFPNSFTHIVGNATEDGTERRLHAVAVQRFQRSNIIFGDWGSTRPGQNGGGGAPIPSRIDIPTLRTWEIFRANPDDDRGFCEMAWDAQHHPCFAGTPDCWGKQMVAVSNDQGEGITSRPVATQARINMHMTIQSGADSQPPTDEVPYQD